MQLRDKKLHDIIQWSKNNNDVRAVLLTSSLVNPLAVVDEFSDLDVEIIFESNTFYISDSGWIEMFGRPIAMVEEGELSFDYKHAMKMVFYDDYVKVDFKLFSKSNFLKEVQLDELPEDWDIGYKVLIDKDGITQNLRKATYQISIINKPTQQKFQQLLNDFWWDTTYVAKCLARDEIFYAKFMSENNIRTDYLTPLIEWYVAGQYDWGITTNKHGRFFKKYVTPEMWRNIEQTFSGSNMEDNWKALFKMADLVNELGTELSKKLGYMYPNELETNVRNYLNKIRSKINDDFSK